MTLTLPKWGFGSPRRLLKTQSSIAGVKTPCLEVFFISLKRSWSVDVENLHGHSKICSISYGWKKGRESNCQFESRPLKVRNQPDLSVCRESVTHRWKDLKKSYKFASDFIPIRGLNKELWTPKVSGVQIGTDSGFILGSLGKKCHSDVGVVE
jgi:hypothetical protein